VYTPESGFNLPAVAFAHDWVTSAEHYAGTLEHLASWGIVVAAPDTERGIAPSVLNLSYDLGTALDIAAGVRLGPGQISVHPGKLGVAGHGFGGSAAVFAAAGMGERIKAVAALFPAITKPPAEQPALGLRHRGLILSAPGEAMTLRSNASLLSQAWPAAIHRTVVKAEAAGLGEGRRWAKFVGLGGSDRRTQKAVRALLTGYLLHMLTGDKTYRVFADPEVALPGTEIPPEELEQITAEQRVAALLKG
jgi:pimeloyl-ACP methyl ester carboxylesterase